MGSLEGVQLLRSHDAAVGSLTVRRALPTRGRRTVGAWCFADHLGPAQLDPDVGADVAPHPHMGLQTVTWLFEGELVHRDSLGTEQPIRAGQLNLMTAGHGISHSEESPAAHPDRLHGIQLWVALPDETRDGEGAFEHHDDLPLVELDGGVATVLVGAISGGASPARADTDHLAVELDLRAGDVELGLDRAREHAVIVVDGRLAVGGVEVGPGQLAYLPPGRDVLDLAVGDAARAMLLGGTPLDEELFMWWNYVARSRHEIVAAHRSWSEDDGRFGTVASVLARTVVDAPAWGA